jgi:peptidoglycan/LPS O-acetylase OafA/YrhL
MRDISGGLHRRPFGIASALPPGANPIDAARRQLSIEQGPEHARRENNFDFLRLIGALLVIYGHAYPLTGTVSPGYAGNGVATIGVKIFFVISGYLVALSWIRDGNLIRFFLRRSLRIFPALAVVVVLTVLVLGPLQTSLPLTEYFNSGSVAFYLCNIALYINYSLPGVFEHNVYPNAVNGSLWSLPAEFFMYLLTPILLARIVNVQRLVFAAITAAFVVLSLVLVHAIPRTSQLVIYATDVRVWLQVAPYFVIGAAVALYRLERLANIYVAFVALLALSVFETPLVVKEAMVMMVLPYVSLSFGLGHAPIFDRITRKNDLSYGVFLLGFPVEQTVTATLGPQIGPWAETIIASVVCIGLAYLLWNLVERPALAWKPGRRRAQGAKMATLSAG